MSDAKNIALTPEANRVAEDLMHRFGLGEKRDASRLGLAYALRYQVSPVRQPGWSAAGGSNAHVGTIDDEHNTLRSLVELHYPDDPAVAAEPYRAVETLMSAGLLLIDQHLQAGSVSDLRDVIAGSPEG